MEEKVLDNFEIDERKNDLENSSQQDDEHFYLFLSGIVFGFGYLMLLINGYYHLKYVEFIQIRRQDLIVRLGFLSYATGFLFYPTSIIVNGILVWIVNGRKRKGILRKISFSFLGLIVPGIVFYGKFGSDVLFGPKEKWMIGILLIAISIYILLKKEKARTSK
jgi:hypothetical protein